ncbi:hypothetical protein N780_01230 [Pontibacillus chungwhensis BH030062]|uniref:Uncharacterized protein n=1 Tax=Pontibacillus chungwhensis BH030062 TaxID=1385513 RepID=A0A0A2UVT6_9BACI|nr:hypothetical protein [Pontibacillus chungwhensis]KGP92372.1 hypothetical protein N780_01230 [Pontibacillus chungwhensis BH030062]
MQLEAFTRVFEDYTDSIHNSLHITFSFNGDYQIAIGKGEDQKIVPLTLEHLQLLYQSIGDHLERHAFRSQLMEDIVQYALSIPTIDGLRSFLREVDQVEGIEVTEIGERIKNNSPAFMFDFLDSLINEVVNERQTAES